MIPIIFAAETTEHAEATGLGALGVSPQAFLIQLATFAIVFMLLKKFAFNKIVKLLEDRRKVLDDGVKLGQKLEKQKAKVDDEVAKILRDARKEADKIIATGHKEAREVVREAEKSARSKAESMISEAEDRIKEEQEQARKRLEGELATLVTEATESMVEEKVDQKRDARLIEKAMKGRTKK